MYSISNMNKVYCAVYLLYLANEATRCRKGHSRNHTLYNRIQIYILGPKFLWSKTKIEYNGTVYNLKARSGYHTNGNQFPKSRTLCMLNTIDLSYIFQLMVENKKNEYLSWKCVSN